jgi:hypothetical protein
MDNLSSDLMKERLMGTRRHEHVVGSAKSGNAGRKDCRKRMSREAFDALQEDPTDPTFVLYTELIKNNPEIPRSLRGEELTTGQNKFLRLLEFDWLVRDGGITQFFLCNPYDIEIVGDTLLELEEKELLDRYSRAVDALVGKKGDWEVLRTGVLSNGESPEYGQFDDAYYERKKQNDNGRWFVVQVGLQKPFLSRLAAYVKSHPQEFITG